MASPPSGWRSCHRQVTDEGVSFSGCRGRHPLHHLIRLVPRHKMVSHGRSASLFASFCSLFDPRFRFAPPRTAGAQLRAPYTGRAFGFANFKASPPLGWRSWLRSRLMRGYLPAGCRGRQPLQYLIRLAAQTAFPIRENVFGSFGGEKSADWGLTNSAYVVQ